MTDANKNTQDTGMDDVIGEDEDENSTPESTEEDEIEHTNNGEEDTQEESSNDEEGGKGENNTIVEVKCLHILLNSAGGGGSLFTLWETGRKGQFCFIPTNNRAWRAEEWLDLTMNHLLLNQ